MERCRIGLLGVVLTRQGWRPSTSSIGSMKRLAPHGECNLLFCLVPFLLSVVGIPNYCLRSLSLNQILFFSKQPHSFTASVAFFDGLTYALRSWNDIQKKQILDLEYKSKHSPKHATTSVESEQRPLVRTAHPHHSKLYPAAQYRQSLKWTTYYARTEITASFRQQAHKLIYHRIIPKHPEIQFLEEASFLTTTTMGLMDSLRNKYELYRLEQRYTKREKRTAFISGAQYVDGEYVYMSSPTSSKSSSSFGSGWSGKRSPSVRVQEVFNKRQSRIY